LVGALVARHLWAHNGCTGRTVTLGALLLGHAVLLNMSTTLGFVCDMAGPHAHRL
jgi:hypothetical protein